MHAFFAHFRMHAFRMNAFRTFRMHACISHACICSMHAFVSHACICTFFCTFRMHAFRMHALRMHAFCMYAFFARMHFFRMHRMRIPRKSALCFFARTTVSIVFCVYCVVCVCTGEGIYTWTRTRARIVRAQIQPLITDFHAEIMTRDSPFYGCQRARPRARILMPPTSRSVVNSVRMHACTFSHACVCVCAHFRMHAYVNVHIFACMRMCMHICACMRMCIFACMRMCIACMRMCMHIFACMRMCQKIGGDFNTYTLSLHRMNVNCSCPNVLVSYLNQQPAGLYDGEQALWYEQHMGVFRDMYAAAMLELCSKAMAGQSDGEEEFKLE